MATTPVTLDFSKAVPIGGAPDADPRPGQLQGAVAFGATQNPDEYAKLLKLKQQTGVSPAVAQGNVPEVQQAADVNRLDYNHFVANSPRIAAWATDDQDNAAVTGVTDLQLLGGVEQHVATMRAMTPMESFGNKVDRLNQSLNQKVYDFPLTRGIISAIGGTVGMAGDLGSFGPIHGDGPTKENLLQRVESGMKPESVFKNDPYVGIANYATSNGLDKAAPIIAGLAFGESEAMAISWAARTFGISQNAARLLTAASVATTFSAQQGGQAYTQMSAAGKSDDESRVAANRAFAVNLPANLLMGFADRIPGLKSSPLMTSGGTGALAGASGALSQNLMTGKPWYTDIFSQAAQGAAIQAGMHIGLSQFHTSLQAASDTLGESKLPERSPETNADALHTIVGDDPSLRIPADRFYAYAQGQNVDPAAFAQHLGSTNFHEAMMAGGDVEIPTDRFLAMDIEHRNALIPEVRNPATELTLHEQEDAAKELEGLDMTKVTSKLQTEMQAAEAETAADPEHQAVKESLRKQYTDAGETPEYADTLSTAAASDIGNLAQGFQMKPTEALAMFNPKVVRGEAPPESAAPGAEAQPSAADADLHQKAIDDIRGVVEAAKEPGHAPQKATVAPVEPWLVETARQHGLDVDGFNHVIDGSAVRHVINKHGDEATENLQGQIAVTDRDFERIPEVLAKPDRVVFGTKNKRGLDQIGYAKRMDDGSTLYIEEARRGRKELAAVSMRKFPATMDADQVSASLHLDARDDGIGPIVVRHPSADNNENEAKSAAEASPDLFHQTGPDGEPRGWLRILPDGSIEIGKTKIGDESTDIHELLGHGYLTVLDRLFKERGDLASETIKADRETILEYLGAKDLESLTTEQHEKFADATLEYLRQGKVPNSGLREVFQRIAVWLQSIFNKASAAGIEISPELRGVMDRRFAAESAVDRAEAAAGPKTFSTPEEAGWTDEQFKDWAEKNNVSVDQAKATIQGRLNEAAARDRQQSWIEEENTVRTAATERIDAQPEYTAIRSLRKGELDDGTELTMSKDELVKLFGEERVKQLQKAHPGLYRNEGGEDPELVAETFGYNSADEMLKAIEAAPKRSAAIETETRDYMTAKHGDIRYDGSLQDEANVALANDTRAENAHRELEALNRKNNPEFELRQAERELKTYQKEQAAEASAKATKKTAKDMESLANALLNQTDAQREQLAAREQRIEALKQKISDLQESVKQAQQENRAGNRFAQAVAPIETYRALAREAIMKGSAADLQPARHLDASRKYAREAFEALAKKDYWEAKQAKHKELLNHFLYREARIEQKFVADLEALAKRVQKAPAQGKLGLAGPEYLAQVNKLMFRFGMRADPPGEAPKGTLAEWVAHERDVLNKDPAIDSSVLDESRSANYRSIPLSELHTVRDALVNMRTLASQELQEIIAGRKIVYAQAASELIAAAHLNNKSKKAPFFERNATAAETVTGYLQRGGAMLNRMEFIFEKLDGGKTGPWHDYLMNPAADCQGLEYALHEATTKAATESLEKMTKEQRLRMTEKVSVPGVTVPITRHELISMALNMGNDSNLDRLGNTLMDEHYAARGFGPHLIDQMKDGMFSREEWQWIQDKWDMLKPLGKAQYELEQRKTGLPPVMVTPVPLDVKTSDGSMMHLDGGYYPVDMDPRYSTRGAEADPGTSAQNLIEKGYSKAVTSRNNMKERTGYGGPLRFDYEQTLTQHVAKVAKDITHRDLVQVGNKLLMDQNIRDTIRETLGPAAEKQFMPWLRTLVNDRNGGVVQGMADGSAAMRALRTNMVKASLTFNLHTSLLQLTHASAIFNEVTPMAYAKSMVKFLAHPIELSKEIGDASPNEMKWRGDNLDRDLQARLHDGSLGKGIGDRLAKAGMMPVQLMDHLLSFPFWDSVYQRELGTRTHLTEDEANYQASRIADAAVRTGLGANAPKDIPPIMRNNDFWKMMTTLGGFENLKYNQIARLSHDALAPNRGSIGARAAKLTFGAACAFIIPSILGAYISGRRPGDDQNPGEWAAMRALLFPVETIPLLGNIAKAIETKGDVQFSPVANIGTRIVKTGIAATSDKEDKDWTGIGLDSLQTAMEAAGIPGTAQIFKTTHYVRKANKGEIENPNVWDAVAGGTRK